MKRYNVGERVQINIPTLREHGVTGIVQSYDEATQWYWVELDQGPPWRGKYEQSELAVIGSRWGLRDERS
jgi:hypothetical protein